MSIQSRREFLKKFGESAATLTFAPPTLAAFLSSCATVNSNKNSVSEKSSSLKKSQQNSYKNLKGISPNSIDQLILSDSLQYKILIQAGDIINPQGENFGWNNDYIAFIPFSSKNLNEGFLWVNHEYPHSLLVANYDGKGSKTREHVEKEQDACGGSILIVKRNHDGAWEVKNNDRRSKRISGRTWIPFSNNLTIAGTKNAFGTTANCAGGITPWKTFLTCEENYDIFYGERTHPNSEIKYNKSQFFWHNHYPNPPEHYGWVVEVNPFHGTAVKQVAMGRFSHESATVTVGKNNIPVVYMGDDVNDGCLYKFIGHKPNSLADGVLYVANMDEKRWIPLDYKNNLKLQKVYSSQLEVLTYARAAAQVIGGTSLDRAEDIEIHPITKSIIVSLTGNPTKGNTYGSLLKVMEKNNDPLSLEFDFENFLAGGPSTGFSCPDNLEFDQNGNLWLTCDISDSSLGKGDYAPFQNNGLYFIPVAGDKAGQVIQVASAPREAELTGPKFSPDYKTLFLSVQHPGGQTTDLNAPTSHWPNGGNSSPKPAVVQIYGAVLEEVTKKSNE